MKYQIYDAGCGDGKTYSAQRRAISSPRKFIFAHDRRDVMPEQIKALKRMAEASNTTPIIRSIFFAQMPDGSFDHTGSANVREDIEALVDMYLEAEHVIILITHEGLKLANLSRFRGWHVVIDEDIAVTEIHSVRTEATTAFFLSAYFLRPSGENAWIVGLADERITPGRVANDDLLRDFRKFHSRVTGPQTVTCNIGDWSLASVPGTQWSWWSVWGLENLEAFETVTVLANDFKKLKTYSVWRHLHPDVVWEDRSTHAARVFAPRTMEVRYFSDIRASRKHLSRPAVGRFITEIAEYIRANTNEPMIWMCNKRYRGCLAAMPGQELPPKQAGTNAYSKFNAAAMFYSSKPATWESTIYDGLSTDDETVIRTQELETMIQFAARTSFREPSSTAPITIWVFDRVQAWAIVHYVDRKAPWVHVTMCKIDEVVYVPDPEMPRGKPGPKPRSPEEVAVAQAKSRELKAAAQRVRRAAAKAGAK